MSDNSETQPGVWGALQRILDTLLATTQNRVELFAVELQEEKCRLIETLLFAAAVAAFGLMALSLVTLTIVLLCWEKGLLPALAGLSVAFIVGAALAWRALQSRLKARSAFADTLEEIKKDRACLETEN